MDLRSAGEPRARVAAIGSSAGGLEALRSMLAHLPAPGPFAYVVAQHLSPRHTSMLRILLARDSPLPVTEATDGAPIRAGQIYVTPPNADILLQDDKVVLRTAAEHGSKPSVDLLFQSVAREYGSRAVAVVLSGSGKDGSRGVRAVKNAGGFVIVQTPATAKFAGMPQAAVETGCADAVLAPEEIGPHLARLAASEPGPSSPTPGPEETLNLEELRSTDEELVTVNDELEIKSNELARLIEDLQSIQDSIDSPILVLDSSGNLQYVNREATRRLGITADMVGGGLAIPAQPRLASTIKARWARVRESGSPLVAQAAVAGRHYRVFVRPRKARLGGSRGYVIFFHDVTELHKVTGRSRRAENRLRELVTSHKAVFDSIPASVAALNSEGEIVAVNEAWTRFAEAGGFRGPEAGAGWNYVEVCERASGPESEGAREIAAGIRRVLAGEIDRFTQDYPCHSPAERRWFQCQVAPFSNKGARGAVVMHIDISPEMKLREALSRQAAALHSSVNGILILDTEGKIDWANEALARMSGFEIAELTGQTPSMLADPSNAASLAEMTAGCRTDGRARDGEALMRSKSGEVYTVRQSATPILDATGQISHIVVVHEDITLHKQAERQMVYLTEHDDLTGLKNRKSFLVNLQEAITRHGRNGGRMAVLFLDLDRFKDTNDTLGHMIGDRILTEIAGRLRSCLRESDTLARFGGDEFVVLVEQLAERERVMLVVERILNSFNRPLEIEGRTIFITASVGVTVFPDDGSSAETLLRNADLAMYRAKAEGRRGYRLYDQKLESEISQRFNIERELGRALGTKDIWLAFQPQIDLRTGAVAGAECLLRWSGCESHEITVGRVISIAEESGAILPIGQWVLREAIHQLRRWHDKGLNLRMSVNLSAVQFHQQDVFGIITDCLGAHGIPPNALKAEITESVLLHRSVRVKEMLHALHGAGIGLILDDFGTGYSSLTYLQHFPIEAVKIDSSFLHGVGKNKNDEAIVRGIIQMAHSLGQKVVAEGVETEEQKQFLMACGCDYAQGYLMAKPLPPAEFEEFLRASRSAKSAAAS